MVAHSTRAPVEATAFTNKDDRTISEAWQARFDAFAALPGLRPADETGDYTPEEQEQWNIIDAAEKRIHAATATTPHEAELQLWTSLYYLFLDNEQVNATHRCDLDWFAAREESFDWSERLAFGAIRSLRSLQAERQMFVEGWLSAWEKDGGAALLCPDAKLHLSFPTYELSPRYVAPAEHMDERFASDFHNTNAQHYHSTMNARVDALKTVPGGVDMVKAYVAGKRSAWL